MKLQTVVFILSTLLNLPYSYSQTLDTTFLDNPTIFKDLALNKSTLNNIETTFGNILKVDTVLVNTMSMYFLGDGCETVFNRKRVFYFQKNSVIIETKEKNDTIKAIIFLTPNLVKTKENIILGNTQLYSLIDNIPKDKLKFSKANYNNKMYYIIDYKDFKYGFEMTHKKIRRRDRKKTISLIMLENQNIK